MNDTEMARAQKLAETINAHNQLMSSVMSLSRPTLAAERPTYPADIMETALRVATDIDADWSFDGRYDERGSERNKLDAAYVIAAALVEVVKKASASSQSDPA